MVKRLEVRIGPDRFHTEIARVNDSSKPTIIDSPLFVGRVLVKIRDFDGVTPDGSPPIRDHDYFMKRNRRFDIQIEGRFKARPGVAPYTGEELQFGTDFDHLVNFPMTPFKLGMRVAKAVDPNVYYDFEPPSKRPFIMSPYLACMNTFSAWPSPAQYPNALVALQNPSGTPAPPNRSRSDSIQDVVPVEASRQVKKYWHFIGLKGDPRIDGLVEKNKHLLPDIPVATAARRPMPRHQSSFGIRTERDEPTEVAQRQKHADLVSKADRPEKSGGALSSLTSKFSKLGTGLSSAGSSSTATSRRSSFDEESPITSEAEDELTPLPGSGSAADISKLPVLKGLAKGDLCFARALHLPDVDASDPIEAQLGPWRFSSPTAEPMEDNTFVFLNENVPIPKRRKYFSKAEALKGFTYDPDVVYGASFFAPYFNFNTFDLAIGPVHMNLNKFFADMPIRYTLRSSRKVAGQQEEETFCTISFALVDV